MFFPVKKNDRKQQRIYHNFVGPSTGVFVGWDFGVHEPGNWVLTALMCNVLVLFGDYKAVCFCDA